MKQERKWISCASFVLMLTISVNAQSATDLFAALTSERQEMSNQLATDQSSLRDLQGTRAVAKNTFQQASQTERQTKKEFQIRNNLALDDPTISTEEARKAYGIKRNARKAAQQKVKTIEMEYQLSKAKVNSDQGQLKNLNRQLSVLREKKLRQEIEKTSIVKAHGEAGCSENLSFGQCKNAALADAKRNAAEQATSMIESETNVKDFVVQNDQVHSRVHALVKKIKILKKGTIGDGIGYFYDIEATVQGQYVPDRVSSTPTLASLHSLAVVSPNSTAFALTVHSDPSYARISILNIKPVYRDGILLEPGRYHIRVKAKGYQSKLRWIEIVNGDQEINIRLARRTQADIAASRSHPMRHASKQCVSEGRRYLDKAATTFNRRKKQGYLELAVQYCPRSPIPYIQMGASQMKYKPSGYMNKAKHLYQTALRLDPGNIAAQEGMQTIQQKEAQQKKTRKLIGNIFGALLN